MSSGHHEIVYAFLHQPFRRRIPAEALPLLLCNAGGAPASDVDMVRMVLEAQVDEADAAATAMSCLGTMKWRREKAELLAQKSRNSRPELEWMHLLAFAREGYNDVVLALLENGVDVDATSERGRTALMEATIGNHYNTVKLLLDRGANRYLADSTGETAADIATMGGQRYQGVLALLRPELQ